MLEIHNDLYRAFAELAYAIAMADGAIQASEKKTFFNIIEREFGKNAWIAENRFELLEAKGTPSIENSYKHALFMMKMNKASLSEEIKEKFIKVIEEIAKSSSGFSMAEEKLIKRFKDDMEII